MLVNRKCRRGLQCNKHGGEVYISQQMITVSLPSKHNSCFDRPALRLDCSFPRSLGWLTTSNYGGMPPSSLKSRPYSAYILSSLTLAHYISLPLGQALVCKRCFSKKSLEDCEENPTEMTTCQEPNPVCMMYQTKAEKDGMSEERHLRYCTTLDRLKLLQRLCDMEPMEIPKLGVVTCRAYTDFCTEEGCFKHV